MLANKKQGPIPLLERLIVLDHDTPNCLILPVVDVDDQRILARGIDGDLSVPIPDAQVKISPEGRVYVLHASETYIQETKHLATVEQAVVLREAVNYQRPGAVERGPGLLMRVLPWIVALVLVILWATKK